MEESIHPGCEYIRNAVMQADSTRLVDLLYEGAIRFINAAKDGLNDKDYEKAHNSIMRAYAIIAELLATLNKEGGGEIAKQLEQCYDYMLHLLKEADINKTEEPLNTALITLHYLLSAMKKMSKASSRC